MNFLPWIIRKVPTVIARQDDRLVATFDKRRDNLKAKALVTADDVRRIKIAYEEDLDWRDSTTNARNAWSNNSGLCSNVSPPRCSE
jgi:hypothetical protein